MRRRILLLMMVLTVACGPLRTHAQAQPQTTLRQLMDQLHRERKVNFVFDARLPVDRPYRGAPLKGLSLQKALRTLFDGTAIEWKIQGNYVLLTTKGSIDQLSRKAPTGRRHTLSGYVRDTSGESLINATVYDLTTGTGTMTNEYGFFSLTLPEGEHALRVSYIGYLNKTEHINLTKDLRLDLRLEGNAQLGEVVVSGDLNSPVLTTQTGKRSLTAKELQTEFALLSSPDVMKTLQTLSGVAQGVEIASGMYVHGGNNDENDILLDGTPLYQTNHLLGLFSSFNTDVIKNVDFYKSGFPARYGGRLSSVVDVRTNDGDMKHLHGGYSIGLLDGRFHLEGPIVKDRTSFNFGLRRSWLDLVTRPVFAIINRKNKEDKLSLHYFFHDVNAKVTHLVNDRSKLSLSLYSGEDEYKIHDEYTDSWGTDNKSNDLDLSDGIFKWGNLNAALNWNYQFSPRLFANFTAVYTHNRTRYNYLDDWTVYNENEKRQQYFHENTFASSINDVGYRTEFDYRPSPRHHIRFGNNYSYHNFHPQKRNTVSYDWDTYSPSDTLRMSSDSGRMYAHELSLYAEDEMHVTDRLSVNGGLHADIFHITGKTFTTLDPRLAMKLQLSHSTSAKLAFTTMTQFMHRMANTYVDMPTDYWVPTTARLRPMHSYQLTGGLYSQLSRHWLVSLEGYYKRSHHLLQYATWMGLEPPAKNWDLLVMDGKGLFYGAEADISYHADRLLLDASYTLSWNKRHYDRYYKDWFYDKFDNRHKINIQLRYKFGRKTEMYAAWTYHTGNHISLPTQYAALPDVPDGKNGQTETDYLYLKPNNAQLPAYHRLDIGFNFNHVTKHQHMRVWNVSLYNAYCHLNPLFSEVKSREDGTFRVKTTGYIPIIPSVSYTIKF